MKSGNLKNVAAFGKLVGICKDLGVKYNPSEAGIKVTALDAMYAQALLLQEALVAARSGYKLAVNVRQEVFAGISAMASRVVRAVAATEKSWENVEDVKMLKRQLTKPGKKKSPPDPAEAPAPANAEDQQNTRSTSKLDFDGKAETFADIIQIVSDIPAYNPNEADLKVATLKIQLTKLRDANEGVNNAASTLSMARGARNKLIRGVGGLYETGKAAKEYIRSVFGVRSDAARQVGQVKLTR